LIFDGYDLLSENAIRADSILFRIDINTINRMENQLVMHLVNSLGALMGLKMGKLEP
jgi:hypothetical protein